MEEGDNNTLDLDGIETEDEMDVNVPPVVAIGRKSKKYGGKEPRKERKKKVFVLKRTKEDINRITSG